MNMDINIEFDYTNKKIGILGGTLNPIHIGHLIIADVAYEELNLDRIIIMPSGNPPHKQDEHILSSRHRSNMIKTSIVNDNRMVFSDMELKREGYIYTADTVSILSEKYPNTQFYFILGEDSIFSIEKWYNPQQIFDKVILAVASRKENGKSSRERLEEKILHLQKKHNGKIIVLNSPLIDISSTDIRERVKAGKSIKYYVTDRTENYIEENNLYKQ